MPLEGPRRAPKSWVRCQDGPQRQPGRVPGRITRNRAQGGCCHAVGLYPSISQSVGFDRFAKMMDEVSTFEAPTYPPYNIERTGENAYALPWRLQASARAISTLRLRKAPDHLRQAPGEGHQVRISPSGDRRPELRTSLPPATMCGAGRRDRERSPSCRPQARTPRGDEATQADRKVIRVRKEAA